MSRVFLKKSFQGNLDLFLASFGKGHLDLLLFFKMCCILLQYLLKKQLYGTF